MRRYTNNKSQYLDPYSPWTTQANNFRINNVNHRKFAVTANDHPYEVVVSTNPKQSHLVDMEVIDASNNESLKTFTAVESHIDQDGLMVSAIDSKTLKSNVVLHDEDIVVFDEFGRTTFKLPTPNYILGGGDGHGAGSVKTPMPCKISQVLVKPGQLIEKGTPLIVLEAMKMEHVIKAPVAGTIDQVLYTVGDLVAENKSLVTFAGDEK